MSFFYRTILSRLKKNYAKLEDKYNDEMGVRKFDPRLSFQLAPRNKENFSAPTLPDGAGGKPSRLRESTGSPLGRRNRLA